MGEAELKAEVLRLRARAALAEAERDCLLDHCLTHRGPRGSWREGWYALEAWDCEHGMLGPFATRAEAVAALYREIGLEA